MFGRHRETGLHELLRQCLLTIKRLSVPLGDNLRVHTLGIVGVANGSKMVVSSNDEPGDDQIVINELWEVGEHVG